MGFNRLIYWAFRQMRVRFFESLLIIIAIGLGVAVLSAVGTLFLNASAPPYLSSTEANVVTLEAKTDDPSLLYLNNSSAPAVPIGLVDAEDVVFDVNFISELSSAIPEIDVILAYQQLGSRLKGAPPLTDDMMFGPIDDPYMVEMMWTMPSTVEYLGGKIAKGDLYTTTDFINAEMFAVVGSKVAKRLFPDEDPLGQLIEFEYQDTPYTIIGVLEEVAVEEPDYYNQFTWIKQQINERIFVSANIHQRGNDNTFRELHLIPKTVDSTFSAKVKDYLTSRWGDSISVNSQSESTKAELKNMIPILILIGGLSSLALFIAALNILNLMLARVLKRTKSIGVAKAIGASNINVFWQYLIESLALGISGGLLGLLIIVALKPILQRALGASYLLSTQSILLSLGSAILMSLLFGIYPAIEASKINPIDALRTE